MSDTLAESATHAIQVRHSRFRAQAAHAPNPPAALAFVAELALVEATHHCWAYRIGPEYRSSDDGEPSGTAGRPILAAIDGQGLDQVIVVVSRWYGGIKLGAGGLVRAYGGAAAECLRVAPRRCLVQMCELMVHAAFDDIGVVHAALVAQSATRLDEAFDSDGVRLRVSLPSDRVDALTTQLRNATRDRVHLAAWPIQ